MGTGAHTDRRRRRRPQCPTRAAAPGSTTRRGAGPGAGGGSGSGGLTSGRMVLGSRSAAACLWIGLILVAVDRLMDQTNRLGPSFPCTSSHISNPPRPHPSPYLGTGRVAAAARGGRARRPDAGGGTRPTVHTAAAAVAAAGWWWCRAWAWWRRSIARCLLCLAPLLPACLCCVLPARRLPTPATDLSQ